MDLCINGNSYVLIERNRLARVTALYPLNYVDMEVIQKEKNYFMKMVILEMYMIQKTYFTLLG